MKTSWTPMEEGGATMPRTDVLGRILACAAHELGPIVEKVKHGRRTFWLGPMEAELQVALRNLGAFSLAQLCGFGEERHKKRVVGHRKVGEGTHRLPYKGNKDKGLQSVFGPIKF